MYIRKDGVPVADDFFVSGVPFGGPLIVDTDTNIIYMYNPDTTEVSPLGGGSGSLDGGTPTSTYGGLGAIDGGGI
jgi:hypothetical protein